MASVAAHHRLGVINHGGTERSNWARSSLPLQSSPTLARVHRATMRLEGLLPSANQRASYTPCVDEPWTEVGSLNSTVQSCTESPAGAAVKRGILLTLRPGTLFRRWKERYFLLTRDYLSCFKVVTTGPTPMGSFIYKVRLAEVRSVTWANSRSDALGTVTLELGAPLSPSYDEPCSPPFSGGDNSPSRPTTIQLRAGQGVKDAVLEDWFELIEECIESSKSRRAARTASINNRPNPSSQNKK